MKKNHNYYFFYVHSPLKKKKKKKINHLWILFAWPKSTVSIFDVKSAQHHLAVTRSFWQKQKQKSRFPVMDLQVEPVSSLCELIFIPYGHEWKPVAAWERKEKHIQI